MRQRRGGTQYGARRCVVNSDVILYRCGVRLCVKMDLFEDNLIDLIRNYPSLYKNKDKKHKSLFLKENYWREIAEKLKTTRK